jgi:hypothetical protein
MNTSETITVRRPTLEGAVAAILVDNGIRGQEKIDEELKQFFITLENAMESEAEHAS